jgi:hypothetical protein
LGTIIKCKEIIKLKKENFDLFKKERSNVLSNLLEEVIKNIYQFEMFTPKFCDLLIEGK